MRVFLTGFMGCGKSTVGPELAKRLGVPFIDLDGEIERRSGQSIASMFEARGEKAFRVREREALLAAGELAAVVVATGGGCPVDPANRVWMRAHGRMIWLHLPWSALVQRLAVERERRPLWTSVEAAEALYERRLHAYQDCDLEVAVRADDAAEAVAARVFQLLGALPDPSRPRPL